MSVPMEEEDEDDDVWDMIRKPLKTVQDVLDYWDHRLEKVNTFKRSRFGSMLLLTILMTRYFMETMESLTLSSCPPLFVAVVLGFIIWSQLV